MATLLAPVHFPGLAPPDCGPAHTVVRNKKPLWCPSQRHAVPPQPWVGAACCSGGICWELEREVVWWLGLAQPGTLGRAASKGWGLRSAAAPLPQPALLGSGGGEHLLSCVILSSVSLVLKAIKSFFYLLLITLLLCLLILFSLGNTGTPALVCHLLGCSVALLGTVLAHPPCPAPAAGGGAPYTSCSPRACHEGWT